MCVYVWCVGEELEPKQARVGPTGRERETQTHTHTEAERRGKDAMHLQNCTGIANGIKGKGVFHSTCVVWGSEGKALRCSAEAANTKNAGSLTYGAYTSKWSPNFGCWFAV